MCLRDTQYSTGEIKKNGPDFISYTHEELLHTAAFKCTTQYASSPSGQKIITALQNAERTTMRLVRSPTEDTVVRHAAQKYSSLSASLASGQLTLE